MNEIVNNTFKNACEISLWPTVQFIIYIDKD